MKKTLLFLLTLFFPFLLKSQVWTKPEAGIPSQNVSSVSLDSTGKIWIGTQSGLAAFEANQWKSYSINNSSYSWDEIFKVWATKDSIWIGTEFRGLWGFDGINKWKHFDPNSSGNGIIGFGKDSKGVLWRLDKFNSFDKWNGKSWEEIPLYIGYANDLFIDREDNIWIVSGNLGLLCYKNGATTNPITNASLYTMIQDPKGFYWIASDNGLLKFDGTNLEIFNTANSNICSNRTRSLAVDQKGSLWVGTWDGGLCKFDGTTWTTFNTTNSPLQSNIINSIAVDKINKIWIANGYNEVLSPSNGKGVFVLDENVDISQGQLPNSPTDLVIKTISENEVILSWKDNSNNEVGFKIERLIGETNDFKQIKFLQSGITTFVDLTVSATNTYYYRIRATNSKGNSGYSNTFSVQPKYCTVNKADYDAYAIATKVVFGQIKNEPFNCRNGYYDYLDKSTELFKGQTLLFTVAFDRCSITTDEIIGGAVYIDWNSDGDFLDTDERIFHDLNIKGRSEYTFPVTVPSTVIPNTTTRLRIRAEEDTYSEIKPCGYAEETQDYSLFIGQAVVLGNPTSLEAKPLSASAIQVSWQDNALEETQYVIERSTDGSSFIKIAQTPSNSVIYTDTSLVADTRYYYRVYALNNTINSTISESGFTTTLSVDFVKVTQGQVASDRGFTVGAFWGDYNSDNKLDLFTADYLLYKNTNGTLDRSLVTFKDAGGGAWADYDNDRDLDLFTTSYNYAAGTANNLLYENKGDGTFIERKPITTDGRVSNCVWIDYNRDGYLDIFLSYLDLNYGKLYKNNGDKSFTQVAQLPGASGFTTFADYDNDGDEDIFVTRWGKDILYDNNGNGTFTQNTTCLITLANDDSKGASWADFDNDGDLDLFVANASNMVGGASNVLYVNLGNKIFTRSLDPVFFQDKGSTYGSAWADYDNDGYLDLFVANFDQENFLYRNNGNGTFLKITQGPPVSESLVYSTTNYSSMGCAWGDYDNNGFLDLFVAKNNGFPNLFYQNKGNDNHWINLLLTGSTSNRSAIGAKVQIKSNNRWQYQQVYSQTGFAGQNSLNVEFGLNKAVLIDSLIILWPSGIRQVQVNVAADQFLEIVEPTAYNITGTITDSNGRRITKGKVIVYQKQLNERFILSSELALNNTNSYQFKTILPGKYAIQIIPDTTSFPGVSSAYFGNTLSLATAALINITTASLSGLDIILPVISNQTSDGRNTIKGILVKEEGNAAGRVSQGTQIQGEAIANTRIYLLTHPDARVIRQAITDQDGSFTFAGLSAGEYQLQVDYQGIAMDPETSKLQINGIVDTLEIIASVYKELIKTQVWQVTGVEDLMSREVSLFPNPSNGLFIIQVNSPLQEVISIRVSNSLGKLIQDMHFIKTGTMLNYPVDLQQYTSGIYIVEIMFGSKQIKKLYKMVKL